MAAKNPRLNVVLSPDTMSIIEQIAKKEGNSQKTIPHDKTWK